MNDHPFDALAKAVAGGLSRRALLLRAGQGLLGSLVAGGLAGALLPAPAAGAALSAARAGDLALAGPAPLPACGEVCAERDAAYTGFCERVFAEDQVQVQQQYQACRAGCSGAGSHRARCEAACGSERADLQARVAASRQSCWSRRAGRLGACLQSCGGSERMG